MNTLNEKFYAVLPIEYDDSLTYPEAVHKTVERINTLIETGSKKYDEIISEIESELQNLKSDVNEQLNDQTTKRGNDTAQRNESIDAEISAREAEDARFIRVIEEALNNVKSYYSRGFILLGNALTSTGKPWTEYVKEKLEGKYQVAEYHDKNGGLSSSNTYPNLGAMYRQALKGVAVPERITDVIVLTGNNDDNPSHAYAVLTESCFAIKSGTPNATLRYGYFGKTKYPNETADAYANIQSELDGLKAQTDVPIEYLADSRYLTGNIDFWNSEKTELKDSACDVLNPYILQLVLKGHVSYNFTRQVTADLPSSFVSGDTTKNALTNAVTLDESYTEDGYKFTASATTSFTDGNSETLGPLFMIPTPETIEDVFNLADSKDTNADPNFTIPTRLGTTSWSGYDGPYYYPAVVFVDTDGVLKLKLLYTNTYLVKKGVGFFVI